MSSSITVWVLILGGLAVLAGAGVLLVRLHRATLALAASQERDVATHGHAVGRAVQHDRGAVTLVWGRFEAPLPFYLRVSSRDPLAAAAGSLGFADLRVGHGAFDGSFVVRTNRPAWARAFLTSERCELLLTKGRIEFVVSSPQNLLSAEWYASLARRDLREIWMIRADGNVEGEALDALVAFGRSLAAEFGAYCTQLPRTEGDTIAEAFEAR
jgi:hypothetical protein